MYTYIYIHTHTHILLYIRTVRSQDEELRPVLGRLLRLVNFIFFLFFF